MRSIDVDVAVVGSGGGGVLAVCVAQDAGNEAIVIERSPVLGGTTAVSGGLLWIPCHPLMEEYGWTDSRDDALAYLRRLTTGNVDDTRLEAYVDTGPEMIRYLLAETPVRLQPIDFPDYHPEWLGSRLGRTLDNLPFATADVPGLSSMVREGTHFPLLTYDEVHRWRWPDRYDWELIADRMMSGVRTLGGALAAALIAGALERNIEFVAGTRACELLTDGPRVTGVACTSESGEDLVVRARRGVILASGGFEWNDSLKRSFLRGPELQSVSPPWNEGDGLMMGMAAGAGVENLGEAWWVPTFNVPGELYDGRPLARIATGPLALPGCVIVNRGGDRFMNEAMNYSDQARGYHAFDAVTYEYPNIPAWMVFDARFKRTYPAAAVMASDDAPSWFLRGDTMEALAAAAGIDETGLARSVAEFNASVQDGHDERFHRGESDYDRYHGDPDAPYANIGAIEEPPFYAVPILPGSTGTKGGLITDESSRVLDFRRAPIPGLYACGNVAASVTWSGYAGAGATLGPALVGGFLAAQTVAKD